MPPACAMAMASRASVTVSMAEETMGTLSVIVRVKRLLTSTWPGMNSEWPGRSRTSSKVSASGKVWAADMGPTPGVKYRARALR